MNSTLSLWGAGSIWAVGLSHQGPDHRRDETKQDTNISNATTLFSYIFIPLEDMDGWMDAVIRLFFLLNFALLGHRGFIDREFLVF